MENQYKLNAEKLAI